MRRSDGTAPDWPNPTTWTLPISECDVRIFRLSDHLDTKVQHLDQNQQSEPSFLNLSSVRHVTGSRVQLWYTWCVIKIQESENLQNTSHLRFEKAFIREQALLWKCGLMEVSVREGHSWTPPSSPVWILSGATFCNKKTRHPPAAAPLSDGPARLQRRKERCFTVLLESNYFWHFSKTMSEVWLSESSLESFRPSLTKSLLSTEKANCAINHTKAVSLPRFIRFLTRLENKSKVRRWLLLQQGDLLHST